MKVYESDKNPISGTDYREVHKRARAVFKVYTARTKRTPYVRSAYFRKDKVFLNLFWSHLRGKNWQDRVRRLKLLPPALDLIRNSRQEPVSKQNPNNHSEILHRFGGMTKERELFYVQIKEDKRSHGKSFMSVFPAQ